jgi:hypothetical protein
MKIKFVVALSLLMMAGCQTVYTPKAREVKKKPKSSGVIAMPTNYRPEDKDKADYYMKQNCGPFAVNITDEGEAVVGQSTKNTASATNREDSRGQVGNLFGIPVMSGTGSGVDSQSSSITEQIKEWQITYVCEPPTSSKTTKR